MTQVFVAEVVRGWSGIGVRSAFIFQRISTRLRDNQPRG